MGTGQGDMKGGVTAGGGKWPMISKSSTMKELIAMVNRAIG